MGKLPTLTPNETIELPSNCSWKVGLDNNLYWWKNTKKQTKRKFIELNIYSNGETNKKKFPVSKSSMLLHADRKSFLYFAEVYTIGGWVSVFSLSGKPQWVWKPKERLHSFATTVDSEGAFWFVTTEDYDNIFSYHPSSDLKSLPFPIKDTVYGIAIKEFSNIYSIQNPTVGHIVMCSDFGGNVVHQIGEVDFEKAFSGKAEDYSIYYPEGIHLDDFERIWIEEMGRDCLTLVDQSLNIIGRFTHEDLGLQSPRKSERSLNETFEYGFGDKVLWVKEARPTPEIILHSYIID